MNERYILLGISAALTLIPLAVLGALGVGLLEDGLSMESIIRNVSLDVIMLATVSKIFALVFGVLTVIQAADAGLIPRFWKPGPKANAKK